MDATRSLAYMQLAQMIEAIGPAKLHEEEQARVREAADTLVLAPELDHEAGEALKSIHRLRARLVESGRFSDELAADLVLKVRACGPLPVSASAAQEPTR